MTRRTLTATVLPGLILLVGLGIGGCGTSEPSRFYVLMPAGSDSAQSDGSAEIRVGLHPFEMPQYLMRPNIVTIQEGNRLEIAEYDRWAESLDANLDRVMTVNLTRMVPRASIQHYPWRREPGVQYEISGEVLQFGREGDGIVRMVVHWTLRVAGDAVGEEHHFAFARPPVGEGLVGVVDMMNQAVNALSEEVAKELDRAVTSAERPTG